MARDDYHVIVVYQILAYLYQQLKKGEPIDGKQISMNSDFFSINERYWKYIIVNMYNEGLISGIVLREVNAIGTDSEIAILKLDRCEITPKGIEYLTNNSFIEKAKGFFKEAKEMIPFI